MRFWVNLVAIGLLSVCLLGAVYSVYADTAQEAADRVAAADQALRVAFSRVLDAEHNGAEVGLLLPRLNEAGSVLSQAEDALKSGNYSKAMTDAGTCTSLANGVAGDAVVLKSDAVAASGNWWVTVLLSVVVSAVFVGVLFVAWRRLKSGHLKRMLGSRPEVTG